MLGLIDLIARHARLIQPGARQIDPSTLRILDHVAGDVCQLKRQPQVLGASQGRRIVHPHDPRHHHPDDAGDVIGVVQRVLQRIVTPADHVHLEPLQQVHRLIGWNAMTHGHALEGGEDRVRLRLAGQGGGGAQAQFVQLLASQHRVDADRAVAQHLSVDLVVAVPAPGIQHPGVVPDRRREQASGGGKALGPLLHRLAAVIQDGVGHAGCLASSIIRAAVALADPTTPGTPAPGWVPAPTK